MDAARWLTAFGVRFAESMCYSFAEEVEETVGIVFNAGFVLVPILEADDVREGFDLEVILHVNGQGIDEC